MVVDGPFQVLRPHCVKVSENPSVEALNILKKELQTFSSTQLQPVQEYILFPLKLSFFREKRTENETMALVDCLQTLLSLTEVQNWQIFSDLFLKLFLLISYPDQTAPIKVLNCREDLKVSVVSCLKMLVECTNVMVKKSMYDSAFCPALGHGVFILLQLIEQERLRSLKLLSVKTLNVLFGLPALGNSTHLDAMNRLASFLPGICMAMTKVASADQKQGQAITVAALETWANVVAGCLHIPLEEDAYEDIATQTQANTLDVHRSRDWVASSASKLQVLFKVIFPLVSHPHYKVRLALIDWARMLLQYCKNPFQDSLVSILECVISLTQDENEDVAAKSRDLIFSFSQQDLSRPLIDTLEESVFALASRLPRLLRSSDETEKLVSLNLLAGYFTLLDDRLESFLHSATHLTRLTQSLLHVAQLDIKHIPLIIPSIGTPSSGCLEFQHFQNKNIFSSLKQVCQILGRKGDLCLLVDHFFEVAQNNLYYREGAIFLINLIVGGATLRKEDKKEVMETVKHLLQVYQSSWLWENEKSPILKALLLEGLSLFAQILGQEVDMQDILCLFLEQAGSSSTWVVHSGQTALYSLASSCCYRSLGDMISQNADYLLHNLSSKLLHFSEYPHLPGLLNVLFSSLNEDMIILFEDIIHQILSTTDACYGDSKGLLYLSVLRKLLSTIKNWSICKDEKQNILCVNKKNAVEPESSKTIKDFLLQHHFNVQASNWSGASEEHEEFPSGNDTSSDNEIKAAELKPLHLKITCQVLEHCGHYMRSPEVQTILVSLDILQFGLGILCQHENELLPMVHQMWNHFQNLFQNSNPVVISKAFETLLQMSFYCKSFIQKRTLDGIWLILLSHLRNRLKKNEKHYASQNSYKMQLLLLSKLGDLAVQLNLEGNHLNNLCQMCIQYLETEQTVEIKKASAHTLSVVKQLDSDAVWWWLTRLSGLSMRLPACPSEDFRTISLPNVNSFTTLSISFMEDLLEFSEKPK